MCGGKGLFQVEDLPVGPRWFCTEKCYAEYAGLPVKESGNYGLDPIEYEDSGDEPEYNWENDNFEAEETMEQKVEKWSNKPYYSTTHTEAPTTVMHPKKCSHYKPLMPTATKSWGTPKWDNLQFYDTIEEMFTDQFDYFAATQAEGMLAEGQEETLAQYNSIKTIGDARKFLRIYGFKLDFAPCFRKERDYDSKALNALPITVYSYDAESFEAEGELEREYFTRFGDERGGKEWGEYKFTWFNDVGDWKPIDEDTTGWDEDDYADFREQKEYELVNDMLSDSYSELYRWIENHETGNQKELYTSYEVLNEDGKKEVLGLLISWKEPEDVQQIIQYYKKEPFHKLEFLAESFEAEKGYRNYGGERWDKITRILVRDEVDEVQNGMNRTQALKTIPPNSEVKKWLRVKRTKEWPGNGRNEYYYYWGLINPEWLKARKKAESFEASSKWAGWCPKCSKWRTKQMSYAPSRYDIRDGVPTGIMLCAKKVRRGGYWKNMEGRPQFCDTPLSKKKGGGGDVPYIPPPFNPNSRQIQMSESKKLPPVEKAGITGIASGATMEGLETILAAEEGEPCPTCKCSHENLKMTDSYNDGGTFWIDIECQDCGLEGGAFTDDVQWEDEGILQSSPQIAYNVGNPNFGALKCSRCFERFEKAAEEDEDDGYWDEGEAPWRESASKDDESNPFSLKNILWLSENNKYPSWINDSEHRVMEKLISLLSNWDFEPEYSEVTQEMLQKACGDFPSKRDMKHTLNSLSKKGLIDVQNVPTGEYKRDKGGFMVIGKDKRPIALTEPLIYPKPLMCLYAWNAGLATPKWLQNEIAENIAQEKKGKLAAEEYKVADEDWKGMKFDERFLIDGGGDSGKEEWRGWSYEDGDITVSVDGSNGHISTNGKRELTIEEARAFLNSKGIPFDNSTDCSNSSCIHEGDWDLVFFNYPNHEKCYKHDWGTPITIKGEGNRCGDVIQKCNLPSCEETKFLESKIHEWGDFYIKDYDYGDGEFYLTQMSQECEHCGKERRGHGGGKVEWDFEAESFAAEEYEVANEENEYAGMSCEDCYEEIKLGDSVHDDGYVLICKKCYSNYKIPCSIEACDERFKNKEEEEEHRQESCDECEGHGWIMTSYTPATYHDPADADGHDCEACDGEGLVCFNAESFSATDTVTVNCHKCDTPMEVEAWKHNKKNPITGQRLNIRHLCAKCSPQPQGLITRGAESDELEESKKRTKMSAIRTGLAITTFGIVLFNLWTNKKQEKDIADIMDLV